MPEPAAAVAEHRVGLAQRVDLGDASRRARPCAPGLMPSASSRARSSSSSRYSLGLARNSCSGGSSRRMVTGSPSIARKMPMKSSRWKGRSLSSAACRAAGSAAMIISRTIGMRSAAKNMCSVRTSPMPSAPNSRALRASSGRVGVGPHAERAVAVGPGQKLLELVAQPAARRSRRRRGSPRRCRRRPRSMSPSRTMRPPASNDAALLVDDDVAGADDAGLAHADGDHGRVRRAAAPRGDDALARRTCRPRPRARSPRARG